MRGKIDLSGHKFAKKRMNAKRSGYKRNRPQKGSTEYRRLWKMVDGAVRDAFANHPEYLTQEGRQGAARSVTKRVTGAVFSYAKAATLARGQRGVRETLRSAVMWMGGAKTHSFTARFLARARRGYSRAKILTGNK